MNGLRRIWVGHAAMVAAPTELIELERGDTEVSGCEVAEIIRKYVPAPEWTNDGRSARDLIMLGLNKVKP